MRGVSFSELVKPLGETAFIEHFYKKEVAHIQQEDRSRFEYLFTWSAINAALSQNLLDRKRLRVARDGRDVPPALYRRENDRDPIVAEKLASLLKQQASLVINRVQDLSPPVRQLTRQIESRLTHPVNVNGYLTFGLGGAFAMHYDPHDVLVLQLYGNKRWFLYDQPEASPLPEQKAKSGKPAERNLVQEFILNAGDVLFVPRGVYHRAAVTDTASVHLTFGIHPLKGVEFVDSLRDQIVEDVLFRQDIATVRGQQALAEQESALKNRLCEIIQAASLSDFIEKNDKNWTPVDRILLGPQPQVTDDTLLAPLVRFRGPRSLKFNDRKPDPQLAAAADRVVDVLLGKDVVNFAGLCSELAGEFDATIVHSAVAALLEDCLIEIVG